MSLHWWALRIIQSCEDRIVSMILRQPGFHRAVGKIHQKVDEAQNGRNPNQPLHPGEATENPNLEARGEQFAKHFLDELKNQFRGKPTELPDERPKK